MADQIVRTLDYDYARLRIDTNLMLNAALRAKKLDEIASRFLARHPDGVGLDLGAGLDTRVFRLDPPPTVDWYDVDLPRSPRPARAWCRTAPAPTSSRRT